MNFSESILIALDSVRGNKLRTFLTLLSVTIGVFAIIAAGAITRSVEESVFSQINAMGEGTLFIQRDPAIQTGHGSSRRMRPRKDVTYKQYKQLQNKLAGVAEYVTAMGAINGKTVKANGVSSDPDVLIYGAEEKTIFAFGRNIIDGRNIVEADIMFGRKVAVIGNDIITKLFKEAKPIGRTISIDGQSYEIIGILNSSGSMMGQSLDNMVFVPLPSFITYHGGDFFRSLTIFVHARNKSEFDEMMSEAVNHFRAIRNLKPWEENDFEIQSNEALSETFKGFTQYLTYFGVISGIISLIAAGIGIMNIMLVSVKERTREIGVRKALGARKSWIMYQFIIETITLCQVGAVFGIVLGIGGTYVITDLISIKMFIPINWIIFAIVICTLLGIVSGAYPAWKAAKLDPIEALRYE